MADRLPSNFSLPLPGMPTPPRSRLPMPLTAKMPTTVSSLTVSRPTVKRDGIEQSTIRSSRPAPKKSSSSMSQVGGSRKPFVPAGGKLKEAPARPTSITAPETSRTCPPKPKPKPKPRPGPLKPLPYPPGTLSRTAADADEPARGMSVSTSKTPRTCPPKPEPKPRPGPLKPRPNPPGTPSQTAPLIDEAPAAESPLGDGGETDKGRELAETTPQTMPCEGGSLHLLRDCFHIVRTTEPEPCGQNCNSLPYEVFGARHQQSLVPTAFLCCLCLDLDLHEETDSAKVTSGRACQPVAAGETQNVYERINANAEIAELRSTVMDDPEDLRDRLEVAKQTVMRLKAWKEQEAAPKISLEHVFRNIPFVH